MDEGFPRQAGRRHALRLARAHVAPVRGTWRIQMHGRSRHRRIQLPQRRHVIQNPEGAALGREDQVVVRHPHSGDRRDRKVELKRLPVPPVVEGDEDAELGPGVDQSSSLGILPNGADGIVGGDPVRPGRERLPRAPEIVRAEDVRAPVILPVSLHGHERPPGLVDGEVDLVDGAARRHAGGSDVRPAGAAVTGEVHPAVIRPGPDHVLRVRRDGEREHGVEDLHARDVMIDRTAGVLLKRAVVRGQIGADRLPAHPAVGRSMHVLGGVVDDVRVVGRDHDGRDPLEPVLQGCSPPPLTAPACSSGSNVAAASCGPTGR